MKKLEYICLEQCSNKEGRVFNKGDIYTTVDLKGMLERYYYVYFIPINDDGFIADFFNKYCISNKLFYYYTDGLETEGYLNVANVLLASLMYDIDKLKVPKSFTDSTYIRSAALKLLTLFSSDNLGALLLEMRLDLEIAYSEVLEYIKSTEVDDCFVYLDSEGDTVFRLERGLKTYNNIIQIESELFEVSIPCENINKHGFHQMDNGLVVIRMCRTFTIFGATLDMTKLTYKELEYVYTSGLFSLFHAIERQVGCVKDTDNEKLIHYTLSLITLLNNLFKSDSYIVLDNCFKDLTLELSLLNRVIGHSNRSNVDDILRSLKSAIAKLI